LFPAIKSHVISGCCEKAFAVLDRNQNVDFFLSLLADWLACLAEVSLNLPLSCFVVSLGFDAVHYLLADQQTANFSLKIVFFGGGRQR
jgi:hypothetical protein